MEVWKCNCLTLCGIDPDGIDNLVGSLKLSSDEDSDGWKVVGWVQVLELRLQEYEPLVVKVQHKGVQRLILSFPAEFSYVLNS
jgi:hypothetical protein